MNEMKVQEFRRRFQIGMGFYALLLFVWVFVVLQLGQSVWSYLAVVLPLIPAVYAMYNNYLSIRQQDELEQKIQLESVLISSFVIGLFAFSWGLLEYASLVPHFHTFLFAPGSIGVWGIVSGIIRRRYM